MNQNESENVKSWKCGCGQVNSSWAFMCGRCERNKDPIKSASSPSVSDDTCAECHTGYFIHKENCKIGILEKEVERLRKENEDLINKLATIADWEGLYEEARDDQLQLRAKLSKYEEELKEAVSFLKSWISDGREQYQNGGISYNLITNSEACCSKIEEALHSSPSNPSEEEEREVSDCMKDRLCHWLDRQSITSENIGDIRRSLFLPWDSEWNSLVRDETATRENKQPAVIDPSLSQPSIKTGVSYMDTKSFQVNCDKVIEKHGELLKRLKDDKLSEEEEKECPDCKNVKIASASCITCGRDIECKVSPYQPLGKPEEEVSAEEALEWLAITRSWIEKDRSCSKEHYLVLECDEDECSTIGSGKTALEAIRSAMKSTSKEMGKL